MGAAAPLPGTRSRWSPDFAKNSLVFEVSSTGRQDRQPMGAAAPLPGTRSRWSPDFAKNSPVFEVSSTGIWLCGTIGFRDSGKNSAIVGAAVVLLPLATGRQGRQPIGATAPPAGTRSRWSLDFVKNFTMSEVSSTAGCDSIPRITKSPLIPRHRRFCHLGAAAGLPNGAGGTVGQANGATRRLEVDGVLRQFPDLAGGGRSQR